MLHNPSFRRCIRLSSFTLSVVSLPVACLAVALTLSPAGAQTPQPGDAPKAEPAPAAPPPSTPPATAPSATPTPVAPTPAPSGDAPKADTPKADAPKADAPSPDQPKAGEAPPAGDDANAVKTVDLPERTTLALKGQSSWDDGYKSVTEAVEKLRAEAARQKLDIAGRPMVVYLETTDDSFKFEAMLPVARAPGADAKLADGFRIAVSPAGKAVKFEHRGAYEEIESTYEAITAWLDEKGLAAADLFIEEFVNDPKGPDDADSAIDIYVPLKSN